MPTTTPARAERAALLDLLRSSGPAAGTLCEGWTTHDLAAHLIVRDRQPLALPGLVVPPLHAVTAAFEQRARTRPYEELVAALQAGPPLVSIARLGDRAELHEWYVHHEDVRRAVAPGPRETGPALEDALWGRLAVMGPALTARAKGLGITLSTPDGRSRRLRSGPAQVVLHGAPSELALWLFGRRAVADVEVQGAPEAVERAGAARLGW